MVCATILFKRFNSVIKQTKKIIYNKQKHFLWPEILNKRSILIMVFISYTVDCGVDILKLIEMFFFIPHISIPIFLVLEINRIKTFVENGGPFLVFALLLSNLDPSDRQDPPLPTSSILLSTLLKSIGH